MAVIADPNIAANVAQVGMGAGTVWTPSHTVQGPIPVGTGGAYRIAMQSGTIAASLTANQELFQFRYVTAASRVCLVHSIKVSAAMDVAASAAALLALRATIARSWSGIGSGGTRATLTTNNAKMRTAHATSEVNDIGMATTGGLTAGTKTLDAQDFGSVAYSALTGAITTDVRGTLVPATFLFANDVAPMAFPLILATQEGFVIRSGSAHPAGMTWHLSVEVAWSEVQSF